MGCISALASQVLSLHYLFQGLCPSSNLTCLSFSVTHGCLWILSPTLLSALSQPPHFPSSHFLSLSDLRAVCGRRLSRLTETSPVWRESMRRDSRSVKGHGVELRGDQQLPNIWRSSIFLSFFDFTCDPSTRGGVERKQHNNNILAHVAVRDV